MGVPGPVAFINGQVDRCVLVEQLSAGSARSVKSPFEHERCSQIDPPDRCDLERSPTTPQLRQSPHPLRPVAMIRHHIFRAMVAAAIPALLSAQSRSLVRPADYGKWESLGQSTLAPDGQWLAYVVNRVNEENELRLGATARDTNVAILYAS